MLLFWVSCVVLHFYTKLSESVNCPNETDSDFELDICVRNNAVYRIAAVTVLFLAVQEVVSICFINMYDLYWWVKFPVVYGGYYLALYHWEVSEFQENAFIWPARLGAFLFLVLQQLIILDFAYLWNASWSGRGVDYTVTDTTDSPRVAVEDKPGCCTCARLCHNVWLLLLLVITSVFLAMFLVAMGLLYSYYGGAGCYVSSTIISLSLVGMVGAGFIQVTGRNGSLMTSATLAVYGEWCVSAVLAVYGEWCVMHVVLFLRDNCTKFLMYVCTTYVCVS
jgi:hypothetical protein